MSGPIDSYVRLTNPGRTASREEAMHLVRERHNAMIKQAEKGAFKDAGKRLVLGPSAAVARIEDEYRTRPTFDWILPSTDVIEQGIQAKKDRGDAMKQAMVRAGNEDERRALAWETRVTEREIANIEAAIGLAPNKEVEGIEDLNAMRALQGASQTGDITEQCLRAMERLGVKPGQKWPVGMKTALMPHQIFAVWWMAHQERHTPYHGSFLADDMGLGKTVSGIAVIKYTLPTRPKNKPGTLVVAPASIITQWTQEVQKHSNLTVLAWRERTRVDGSNGLRLLSQFDVIVTSYEQMVIEWEAKGPLYRAHWFRVVWDECQLLRNKMSKRSQASCNLKAQYRLLMSGTPIQNKLEEAFPHFRTLGLPVLRTEDGFHDAIGGKTGRAGPAALSVVYKAHLLRRVQETLFEGEPIVNLLPKEQVEIRVVLGPERAAEYRSRRAKDKREWIERTKKSKGAKPSATAVQWARARLHENRRWLDHPAIPGPKDDAHQGRDDEEAQEHLAYWTEREHDAGIDVAMQARAHCCVCQDPWRAGQDMFVTPCSHVLCIGCHDKKRNKALCPATRCKREKGATLAVTDSFLKVAVGQGHLQAHVQRALRMGLWSEKPTALWKSMQSYLRQDPGVKFVVTSIWTAPLDILDECFKSKPELKVGRYQGNTRPHVREALRERFVSSTREDSINVLLLSLLSGGVGLNLAAKEANVVMYIYEPDYNPANEWQVEARVHRIGAENHQVTICRLITADSDEEGIQKIQRLKTAIVEGSWGESDEEGVALQHYQMLFDAYDLEDPAEEPPRTSKRRLE